MDPDPLRLLETAHPLRSRSISQGPPRSPFTIRPNCRLKRPSKLVNKTVNKFIKFVDGPTQMSRSRFLLGQANRLVFLEATAPRRELLTFEVYPLPNRPRPRSRSRPVPCLIAWLWSGLETPPTPRGGPPTPSPAPRAGRKLAG